MLLCSAHLDTAVARRHRHEVRQEAVHFAQHWGLMLAPAAGSSCARHAFGTANTTLAQKQQHTDL